MDTDTDREEHMTAKVTVKVTTHQRGTNVLPKLTLLLSEAMEIENMEVGTNNLDSKYSAGGTALFIGHTEASLAQFTSHLYGSPLEGQIRDVSYTVQRAMPLTDLQARNKELLEQANEHD